MKARKTICAILIAVLGLVLVGGPAWADRGRRPPGPYYPPPHHGTRHHHGGDHHRAHDAWKWGALGLGAAIVGGALLAPRIVAAPPPPPPCAGHWESRRVWVPPTYERTWNPAHYNRRGEWVPGGWIELERSAGYYRDERVWVDCP